MSTFYADSGSFSKLSVTNLTATTSSILYITSSQLDVGTNIITLNTNAAPQRYGGIAVADSGSSPILSGSLLFDSQNNQWIYVHQSAPAAATTSSVLIMGPQTFNSIGNELTIAANRLTKGQSGDLGEHITSSNITDTGTVVSIDSNTQITGSLTVTAGITGSLLGTASTASYVLQAVSASYASNGGVTQIVAGTNVTISPVDGTGAVTINASGTGGGSSGSVDLGKVISITQIMYPFSGF